MLETRQAYRVALILTLPVLMMQWAPWAAATWYQTPLAFTDGTYQIVSRVDLAPLLGNTATPVGAYYGRRYDEGDQKDYYVVRVRRGAGHETVWGEYDLTRFILLSNPSVSRISDSSIYVAWLMVDRIEGDLLFQYSHYNGSTWSVPATLWPNTGEDTNATTVGLYLDNWDEWGTDWDAFGYVEIYDDNDFGIGYGTCTYDDDEGDYLQKGCWVMQQNGNQYPSSSSPAIHSFWKSRPTLKSTPVISYHKGMGGNGKSCIMYYNAEWQSTPTIYSAGEGSHSVSGATTFKVICTEDGTRYAIWSQLGGIRYAENDNSGWGSSILVSSGSVLDAVAHPTANRDWSVLILNPLDTDCWAGSGEPPAASVFSKGDCHPGELIADDTSFWFNTGSIGAIEDGEDVDTISCLATNEIGHLTVQMPW